MPVSGKLLGMDALLSMVQMPSGVPVGVVGIDNGANAALLALRILKLNMPERQQERIKFDKRDADARR